MMEDFLRNMAVEATIRFKNGVLPTYPLMELIDPFIFIRRADKVVALFPLDWECFKNGKALEFAKSGLDSYWALSYFSVDGERVADFEGNFLTPYSSEWDGVKADKYVKRTLCVVKTPVPGMGGCVELAGFGIRLQSQVPAVKLFSMRFFNADGLEISGEFFSAIKKMSKKALDEAKSTED